MYHIKSRIIHIIPVDIYDMTSLFSLILFRIPNTNPVKYCGTSLDSTEGLWMFRIQKFAINEFPSFEIHTQIID